VHGKIHRWGCSFKGINSGKFLVSNKSWQKESFSFSNYHKFGACFVAIQNSVWKIVEVNVLDI